jgi:hypothetical protein
MLGDFNEDTTKSKSKSKPKAQALCHLNLKGHMRIMLDAR